MKLGIQNVKEYLGEPTRVSGDEYTFPCPICQEEGHDRHRDNLKYNSKKDILCCFANSEHSKEIIKGMYNANLIEKDTNYRKMENKDMNNSSNMIIDKNEIGQLKNFVFECNNNLLNSTLYLSELQNIRYINKKTVEDLLIGFNTDYECWIFPTIKYSTDKDIRNSVILSIEMRPLNFDKSGIYRHGSGTGLGMINSYSKYTEILVIVEGYLDGYALYQRLCEMEQSQYYQIVTCSNGVNSLKKQINEIDFLKYKKIYLFIDNDEVSRPIAQDIIDEYPFIDDFVLPCGCKDFNEHYIKCITNGNVF